MTPHATAPHRILVVRTDRLGDMVLTLPMLAALRRCFPSAHIAVLLRRYTSGIVEGNPHVNQLVWYDRDGEPVPFFEMARTLRSGAFDAVVVVYPTFRLAAIMALARIPVRVGTGYRSYSLLFNRRVYEHRRDARRHELEYNLRLLTELGCAAAGPPEFTIAVSRAAREKAEEVLRSVGMNPGRSYAVLHPGSGGSARNWPHDRFGELAARLVGTADLQIVVTGSATEAVLAADVVRLAGRGAASVAGLLTVQELAALLEGAAVFVSNSTGPLHMAVAVGTPVVGLYPPHPAMSKARWGPYSGRNRVLVPDRPSDCEDCVKPQTGRCACMDSISVDAVASAVMDLLAGTAGGASARGSHV